MNETRKIRVTEEDITRFWSRVDKDSSPHGCWLWTAYTQYGYGRFKLNGRPELAHRIALAIQSIKDGRISLPIGHSLEAAHNCPGGDNPSCVNPAHLRWLTSAEHDAETSAKGQFNPATGDRNGSRTKPECLNPVTGIENGMATVPDEDAALLVVRVLDGETSAAVARDVGMSEQTLRYWAQGVYRAPILARAREIIEGRTGCANRVDSSGGGS